MLGDIGSILELIGMYYVVLSMVVNGAVFGLDLVVSGIPVGTISISLVIIGFAVNFIFGNYEKSILQSVLDSLKDIVSMLLGVVNVFSDIVSYIRLWAVGLAGAAISSTVNEMVSPLLGHFIFIIFAVSRAGIRPWAEYDFECIVCHRPRHPAEYPGIFHTHRPVVERP